MEWVSIVRIEADYDPGHELVTLLKARFGEQVRTQTKEGWLHDLERQPEVAFQAVRPGFDTKARKLA